MRKLAFRPSYVLAACLLCGCSRSLSREEAVKLLTTSSQFTLSGRQHREVVDVKWIVKYAPDTPNDYDVGFTWKWHSDSRIFQSVAEFSNQDGHWILQSFRDENHNLVQIGALIREGPPERVPQEWDKLRLKVITPPRARKSEKPE
jgi:hypothetical protein